MDFLRSVFESTAVKVIALLVAPVIAAWISRMREKGSRWAGPILYGLGAYGLIMFALIGIRLWIAPQPPERATPGNVEEHLITWLNEFGLGMRRTVQPNTFFTYDVTLNSGNHITIGRTNDRNRYLVFQAGIAISPEHTTILNALSEIQRVRVFDQVLLELSLARINYGAAQQDGHITGFNLTRVVPIEGLTVDSLIGSCDAIDQDMNLTREAVRVSAGAVAPTLR
jgi:hypothetical protein